MPARCRVVIWLVSLSIFAACGDDGPEPVGLMWGSGASGAFVGDTISLVVFYRDAAGDPIGMPRPSVSWTSSRPGVATIVSESMAVALDTGRVVFTATTASGPNYALPVSFEIIQAWDGRLVWARTVSGAQPTLHVRHLPSHEVRRLPEFGYPGQGHGDPYISSNGTMVAAIADRPSGPAAPSTIFIINLADSSVAAPFDALPGYQIAPVWMPGDSLIAFLANLTGGWEIYTARVDGSGVTQRTQLGQSNPPFFDVTPEGTFVVELRPPTDLFEMTLTGDTIRRLTSRPDQEAAPSVSPDGTMIAFVGGEGHVWIMNRDGTNARELLPARRVAASARTALPSGSGHPSWTADSRFVLLHWFIDPWWTGSSYSTMSEVYAIRVADSLAIRLTRSPGVDAQPVFR